MPNRKNPGMPVKRAFVPAGQADLTGDLLVWAREQELAGDEPLFFSRKRGPDGRRKAISRQQAWAVVKAASERADVRVLALRASGAGAAGEPAPIHPHLLRPARVRQIVRSTKSLPVIQRQAGWSRAAHGLPDRRRREGPPGDARRGGVEWCVDRAARGPHGRAGRQARRGRARSEEVSQPLAAPGWRPRTRRRTCRSG
jgi:hypothetical protein